MITPCPGVIAGERRAVLRDVGGAVVEYATRGTFARRRIAPSDYVNIAHPHAGQWPDRPPPGIAHGTYCHLLGLVPGGESQRNAGDHWHLPLGGTHVVQRHSHPSKRDSDPV